ncbi:MAG: biotin/lipoyl-containing protein, partial [Aeromicrobium sp.]
MATLLRVPEVAAGATEVVLSEWLVDEGGDLAQGDPVVVVETEKAIVEVEAETAGIVLRRLADAGTSIEVGSPIALVGLAAETGDVDAILQELGVVPGGGSPAPERREVEATDAAVRTTEAASDPESGAPVAEAPTAVIEAADPSVEAPSPPDAEASTGDRIFASPISRRLLATAGISLDSVVGTGPNGRITRKDAELAMNGRAQESAQGEAETASSTPDVADSAPPAPSRRTPAASAGFEEVEHSRLRRAVANRLTSSKQTVPHFYVKRSVRIDELLRVRAQLNEVS